MSGPSLTPLVLISLVKVLLSPEADISEKERYRIPLRILPWPNAISMQIIEALAQMLSCLIREIAEISAARFVEKRGG